MARKQRFVAGLVVAGLFMPALSGCASAKNICPDLEKLAAKITSPPTYAEIDNAIQLLQEAGSTDNQQLNGEAKNALHHAQAVKDAMGKKNNLAQVEELLGDLQADLDGISGDCSQIVGGEGGSDQNSNAN